jgi:hypothetical protein
MNTSPSAPYSSAASTALPSALMQGVERDFQIVVGFLPITG